MCNEKYIKDDLYLSKSIHIKGNISQFDLYVNNDLVIDRCTNFSYIPNLMFVTKKGYYIYIFGTNPVKFDNKYILVPLAKFCILSDDVYAKIVIEDKIYVINSNCEVALIEEKDLTNGSKLS